MHTTLIAASAVAFLALASTVYAADDTQEATLVIKNHEFHPKELVIKANTPLVLTVKNEDATPAEFESEELKREKVIKGNGEVIVKLGPLKPGRYPFFEEFHAATGQGALIAK